MEREGAAGPQPLWGSGRPTRRSDRRRTITSPAYAPNPRSEVGK